MSLTNGQETQFSAGVAGIVPGPTAAQVSALNLLRADGTWAAGPTGTLPSQTGNNKSLLTTDGTNAAWTNPALVGATGGALYDAGGTIAAQRNALAPRQGLAFDGTSETTATLAAAIGSGDKTFAVAFRVESVGSGILHVGTSASTVARQIAISQQSNRKIRVELLGATTSDISQANTDAAIAEAGVWASLTVTISGSTLTIYVNGVSVAYSVVTAGSAPAWSDAINGTVLNFGGLGAAGYASTAMRLLAIENRALSDAEVLALYQSGAVDAKDFNNASNTSIVTTAFVNSGYSTFTGASATGYTAATASGSNLVTSGNPTSGMTVKSGTRWRLSFSATLTSGAVPTVALRGSVSEQGTVAIAAGANLIEITMGQTGASDSLGFAIFRTTGASSYAISSFSLTPLGALIAPEANAPGSGYVWNDISGNGATIVFPASGVDWSLPSVSESALRGSTNTNGNQQLLGANCIKGGTHIEAIVIRALTGTPNVKIGYSSGGNEVANLVSLLANTWTEVTVKNPGNIYGSDGPIWISSTTTDTVQFRAILQPLY